MNPCSKDIADFLATTGLGLVLGTNLFVGEEPATPADTTTVYDTPGSKPQSTMDKARYDFPAIQVRVRNVSYLSGWALVDSIRTLLHQKAHFDQGGARYELIECDQEPFPLGKDDLGRQWFVCNFSVQRRPT